MKTYRTQTKHTKEHLNSNCYIRLTYVKDKNTLTNIFKYGKLDSNISNSDTFISELVSYEESNINGKRKDTNFNYGVVLTFLLEREENNNNIIKLVREITGKYNNLPYYSYLSKIGKGNYLHIYLCERYYYPNGYIKEVRAKQDSYRDALTGKACKKEDKNAILWRKKGDIISTSNQLFSSKVRYFRYANESQFYKCMDNLKLYFIELCKKFFNTIVITGITFRKYVLSILNLKQKRVARVWHQALYKMEDKFNYALEVLEHTGYLEDAKKQLDNLFIKYNTLIHSNKNYYDNYKFYIPLNYGKVKFSIDFNNNYKKAKADSDLLKDKFIKELDAIVFKFLPQI